jgi:hypothetical protein
MFPHVQRPVGADRSHSVEKPLHLRRRGTKTFQPAVFNGCGAACVLHGDGLDRLPEGDPLGGEIERDEALRSNRFKIREEALQHDAVLRISGEYDDS